MDRIDPNRLVQAHQPQLITQIPRSFDALHKGQTRRTHRPVVEELLQSRQLSFFVSAELELLRDQGGSGLFAAYEAADGVGVGHDLSSEFLNARRDGSGEHGLFKSWTGASGEDGVGLNEKVVFK
jgi:hypothetical protein